MGWNSDEPYYVYMFSGRTKKRQRVFKIGVSYRPQTRFMETHVHKPESIRWLIPCSTPRIARKVESCLHRAFSHCALGNEWFDLEFAQRAWIQTIKNGDDFINGTESWQSHYCGEKLEAVKRDYRMFSGDPEPKQA